MKRYEIKSIALGSVFRFFLAVGVVVGLIACIVVFAIGASPSELGIDLGVLNENTGAGTIIVTAIVASVGYGLAMGLAGTILSFLYNLFTAAVGGIVIRVSEKE